MLARFVHGVLEVVTSSGSLYIRPSAIERLSLIWIFRNFRHLPVTVLSGRDQKIIESIAFNRKRVSCSDEIIGTVDCCPMGKKSTRTYVRRAPMRESAEV